MAPIQRSPTGPRVTNDSLGGLPRGNKMNGLSSAPASHRTAGEEGYVKFWPLPSVPLLVTKQGVTPTSMLPM